jgi:hypothetical protein
MTPQQPVRYHVISSVLAKSVILHGLPFFPGFCNSHNRCIGSRLGLYFHCIDSNSIPGRCHGRLIHLFRHGFNSRHTNDEDGQEY